MQDLNRFRKPGYWLAVTIKHGKIQVVAKDKQPEKALRLAQEAGVKDTSLMLSSSNYAAWAPRVK